MDEKVRLKILGLTYSQTQTGSYALVLAEESGERRIPIMIGAFEAQAIALHMEELHPPRPLTHDLFKSFAKAFSVVLKEVNINKLEEGIFYSELYFYNGEDIVVIDSRTSDAVALALRFKCPIYTTRAILDKAGIVLEDQEEQSEETNEELSDSIEYSNKDKSELEALLIEAIAEENYEKAAEIQREIDRRGFKK
ncbi:MAG: bifunctional nuclease family protein [Bacteroidetes bacterium]|nr:bifunctional nuclease family protein [Bacteroidota bacterium]MBT4408472.1 bifunctional nuclease family protein [Bacteroidota bacterium]